MKVFYPDYFEQFQCLAEACPDSCCKQWAVDIDPKTADFYRNLSGPLGDSLRAVLTEDNTMTLQNKRCPMWRQDGLCEIQAQLGHDALCRTCQDFPRIRHDYGDFTEYGLELSCPEAARLILSAKSHRFLEKSAPEGEIPEYDPEIMTLLRKSRQAVLDFLEEDLPLGRSLAAILLYAHHVQAGIDGEDFATTPADCYRQVPQFAGAGNLVCLLDFFQDLEILTEDWQNLLAQNPQSVLWSKPMRAMARYLVERYWLQAVSDFDLVCRGKFIVVGCLLAGALGGDFFRTAQLFSKEIENDPDNVEAILDGAYSAPAFTDRNLFALLLAE